MTSRRPLTVVHVTAERGFSGGEVQVFLLLEGLRERGHHGVLVCPSHSRSADEARRRGFQTVALPMRSGASPRSLFDLTRELRRIGPDLVHLHSGRASWWGGLAAWRLGLPALATRRMDRAVRRGWHTRWLYAHALRAVVAISDGVAERLLAGGVPERAIRVVPSAVEPGRLLPQRSREAVRQRLGVAPDTPCLLAAAALVRRKGLDVLLEALAELTAADASPTLWIAGEGPQRRALEQQARALGIGGRVRLLGQRDDVPELLAACDVFVLPSRQEGLGVAALEAMALGRPVVASRVGGLGGAVVHEHTGLLVPPEDARALRDALARLLRDAELRARLGSAGPRHVAERYAAGSMVDAYERLYEELLGAQGALAPSLAR